MYIQTHIQHIHMHTQKWLKNQKVKWNCLIHKHSYLFTSWSNNKLWFTLSNLFFLDRQLFLTSMSPFIHERSPSAFFSPRRGWLRSATRERTSFQSAESRKMEKIQNLKATKTEYNFLSGFTIKQSRYSIFLL